METIVNNYNDNNFHFISSKIISNKSKYITFKFNIKLEQERAIFRKLNSAGKYDRCNNTISTSN